MDTSKHHARSSHITYFYQISTVCEPNLPTVLVLRELWHDKPQRRWSQLVQTEALGCEGQKFFFRFYTNHDAMCNVHIVHDPAMPSVLMCNIYQELYSVLAVSSLPHSAPLKSAWRAWLEPGSKISMNKSSKIDRRRQHHHQHHTTPGTTSNARYCAM